jgi:non-specific serine/threonine protein kinase/serine/threonine-protein kinase
MEPSVGERGAVVGDRYRLGERLGRGGMADVYAGYDLRLERDVAVKLLRPEVALRQPEVRTRFEGEARTAARLAHPNVVEVFDTGEEDGQPYIVMERMPGETLADRIASGPVDLEWLRRVAGDVLGALGAAHAAGMVHRDVKPGNILIAEDGRAKVADFGIAKSLDGTGPDLTATNLLIGTPAYLAPEQLTGEPATPRSDLYALGVVLYEAAAGQKPFQAPTPIALALAVQDGKVEPLAQLRPDVNGSLAATIERAMAPDPDRRFGSAVEMAGGLGLAPGGDTTLEQLVTEDAPTEHLPTVVVASSPPPAAAARPPWQWPRWPVGRIAWRPLAIGAAALVGLLVVLSAALADDGTPPARADADTSATTDGTPATTAAAPATTVRVFAPDPESELELEIPGRDEDKPGKGEGRGDKEDDGDD